MPRLDAMVDRTERELHDRYFDADHHDQVEAAREDRHNLRLEWLADADCVVDCVVEAEREVGR